MTEGKDPKSTRDPDEGDASDSVEESVRSILRRAHIPRTPEVDLLKGVQHRIRERSRGKFYGDGWSRSRSATSTYIVTSILMLVILSLVYFVLVPEIRVP